MFHAFAAPGFARLWIAGAVANAMLWFEVLAAGLFTLATTGSGLAVAIVSAARALPLLGAGALVGVLSDTVDRKVIVVAGLALTASSSTVVAILAASRLLQPWQLAVAAFASGFVYATEMPARRRMIAECVPPPRLGRAVALDSLTNFATRCAGPLAGGAGFAAAGIGGTFAASAALSLVGAMIVAGGSYRQARRKLRLSHAYRDLADGLAFARRTPAIRVLLGVTITMNLFGFSYSALIPTIGELSFHLTSARTGILAAAEPAGSLLCGLVLTATRLPGRPLLWLGGGVALLLTALAAASRAAPLWPACFVLFAGGAGSALFINHQTTIVLDSTPDVLRSRVMGLVTVCIGCWPLGMLVAGGLLRYLSPSDALAALAVSGLVALVAVAAAGNTSLRS